MSRTSTAESVGISLGSAIAVCISYTTYGSVFWAAIHGLFGWFYVVYALMTGVASF